MSWPARARASILGRMLRPLALSLLTLSACAELGPECQRLSECCEGFSDPTSRSSCLAGLDEHGTKDGAETYCRSTADSLIAVGQCTARAGPAGSDAGVGGGGGSCEKLRACCQQITSGPYRADCLVAAGQLEVQPNAESACRQTLDGYAGDGWCVVAGAAGREDNDLTCSDGVDNDGNGHTDCRDWSCSRNPAVKVCGQPEGDERTCADGIDNDQNGFTDCEDRACSQNPGVTVCRTPEDDDDACSDGRDNDGDRFVDCDDYDCSRNPSVSVCG